jgi:GntR family transcriptional repressor for pyruvate dehydrogenase complex
MPGQAPPRPLPSRRRLSEDVADEIQTEVLSARLQPGDRLPTEAELAVRFDVSRSVVREAAKLLIQRGLVDVRPGRGMVVAKRTLDGIVDQYALLLETDAATFHQLMEVRLVLEVEISAVAALSRKAHHLQDMLAALTLAEDHRDDAATCLAADLAFHKAVAQATGNRFFALLTRPINEYLRRAYSHGFADMAHQEATLQEHRRLYEAIAVGDPDAARAATRAHLERVVAAEKELVGAPELTDRPSTM